MRVLAVLLMLGVTLIAAELIARLAFPVYSDDPRYSRLVFERLLNSGVVAQNQGGDPERFLAYTPNAVSTVETPEYRYTMHTNSLGFRSKEIVAPRSGEYRVWLLGDSMFVGVGAQETERIDVQLEELGRRGAAGDIAGLSVFNFSVGGFNTGQELAVLQRFIQEVRPDRVVLGFFVGNDFLPNAIVTVDKSGHYAVDSERAQSLAAEVETECPFVFAPSVVWRILALNLFVPRLRYVLASRPEILDRSFGFLRRIQEECRQHGAALMVVVIYPRDGVGGGWVEDWSHSRAAGETIVRFCRREGIEVLDLLSIMSGSSAARKFFFKNDGHFNPAGNRAVAEALYREMLSGNLRPAAHPGAP